MDPLFLTLEEALEIQRHQIDIYGGTHGLRDPGLLESALAQPQAVFGGEFLCKDLFEMAAAYLFHIVQNHPFQDGNKRAGAICAFVFLGMNQIKLTAASDAFETLVLQTSKGKAKKPDIAEFFRKHCRT